MKKLTRYCLAFLLISQADAQSFVCGDLHRGSTFIFQEVNFFSDQFHLIDSVYEELDYLVKCMEEYDRMVVEITGHTDIEGDKTENLELSRLRAESVKSYLIGRGISDRRINAVGKGAKKPLVDESSPLNQRIEFTVISNPHLKREKGYEESLRSQGLDTSHQKRMALVIGNADYQSSSKLKNPLNDAQVMSEALTELRFDVIKLTNLSYQDMIQALKEFSAKVQQADVALFYFAGHGLQVNGTNYLLPIDADLNGETDVPFESINLELVLKVMEYTNQKCLNLIILDACRNNPYVSWNRGGEGLAEVKAPTGTLIAYSTSPGSIASDGDGDNGLYTSILVKQLRQPQRLIDIFIHTRIEVEELSQGRQSPWELAKLRGKFYLR